MNHDQAKPLLPQQIFPESVVGVDAGAFHVASQDPQVILQAATISTSHSGTSCDPDSALSNAFKFFQEFKRIYFISFNLDQQKIHLFRTIEHMTDKITNIERNLQGQRQQPRQLKPLDQRVEKNSDDTVNKRLRRTAEQIQKRYTCEVAYCKKQYGSEGSLQQHIKLKHRQLRRELRVEGSEVGSVYNADNDCSSI